MSRLLLYTARRILLYLASYIRIPPNIMAFAKLKKVHSKSDLHEIALYINMYYSPGFSTKDEDNSQLTGSVYTITLKISLS